MRKTRREFLRAQGKPLMAILSESGAPREWLRESAWTFLGVLLSRGSALILSIAAARMLAAADFATFALAQNLQVGSTVLLGLGFGNAMAKYVGQDWASSPESGARTMHWVRTKGLVAGAAIAVGLGLASRPLASAVFGETSLWWLVGLCALAALGNAQIGILNSAYAAIVHMRSYSGIVSKTAVVILPILVGAAAMGGLNWLLVGWTISFLVTAAILTKALRERVLATVGGPLPSTATLGPQGFQRFVLMAGAANILVYPMHVVAVGLLRHSHGSEAASVYQVCVLWMTALTLFPGTLANNLVAAVARDTSEHSRGTRLSRAALKVMAGLAAAVALLGLASAPIISAAYGRIMTGQWPSLALIAVAAAATTLTGGVWPTLMVTRGAHSQLRLNGVFAASYVLSALLLVPKHGVAGAALACVIGSALQAAAAFGSLRLR